MFLCHTHKNIPIKFSVAEAVQFPLFFIKKILELWVECVANCSDNEILQALVTAINFIVKTMYTALYKFFKEMVRVYTPKMSNSSAACLSLVLLIQTIFSKL